MIVFNKQNIFSELMNPTTNNQNFNLTQTHKIHPMYENSLCMRSINILGQSFGIISQIHQNQERSFKYMGIKLFPKSQLEGQILCKFWKTSKGHQLSDLSQNSSLILSKFCRDLEKIWIFNSLCDFSCLSELIVVLKKLKNVKQLCLVIRRFYFYGLQYLNKKDLMIIMMLLKPKKSKILPEMSISWWDWQN